MKKILWIFIFFTLVLIPPVFPYGSWFDDFETYADQSAMDNPSNPLYKWDSADGKAKGILDTTGYHIKNKSMLCQQYPTETRPTRIIGYQKDSDPWIPYQGCLSLWVYDDGADIKSFDIRVENATHYVGIGLRDDQVGVDTEYTCNKDGVVTNTGIARSKGWHVFQFSINNVAGTEAASGLPYITGAEMMIDAQRWSGNVLTSMTEVTDLTIYTNFGNPTDENKIWIDSVQWLSVYVYPMGVPRAARMGNISNEFQPPTGLSEWDVLAGSNTALTNAPDGLDPSNLYLDAFDADGEVKGFYYKGTMVVPRTAYYVFECPYMNGPTWDTHNPWPDLTFKVGNTEFKEGSTTTGDDWAYVASPGGLNWYYRTHAPLVGGDTISIEVTGDSLSTLPNCFVRISSCELLYVSDYTPPPPATGVQDAWNLYE